MVNIEYTEIDKVLDEKWFNKSYLAQDRRDLVEALIVLFESKLKGVREDAESFRKGHEQAWKTVGVLMGVSPNEAEKKLKEIFGRKSSKVFICPHQPIGMCKFCKHLKSKSGGKEK
jgi:hypothetical protein